MQGAPAEGPLAGRQRGVAGRSRQSSSALQPVQAATRGGAESDSASSSCSSSSAGRRRDIPRCVGEASESEAEALTDRPPPQRTVQSAPQHDSPPHGAFLPSYGRQVASHLLWSFGLRTQCGVLAESHHIYLSNSTPTTIWFFHTPCGSFSSASPSPILRAAPPLPSISAPPAPPAPSTNGAPRLLPVLLAARGRRPGGAGGSVLATGGLGHHRHGPRLHVHLQRQRRDGLHGAARAERLRLLEHRESHRPRRPAPEKGSCGALLSLPLPPFPSPNPFSLAAAPGSPLLPRPARSTRGRTSAAPTTAARRPPSAASRGR